MTRYLVIRAIQGFLTLIITMMLVFVMLRLIPSDPAAVLLRDDATPEQIAHVRQLWGLDQPIQVQFAVYLGNLLRGNAGDSFQYQYTAGSSGTPAFQLVISRAPATIQLALVALLISIVVSVPLGMITALKRDTFFDHLVTMTALMFGALPNFWIGMQLILLFGLALHLLPTSGIGTPQHVILPAITLAVPFSVVLIRLTRTEMARVLQADYMRTAYSKGLPVKVALYRHALRNVLIPLVTVTGLRLGTLLNGSVVVETLFGWPGIGRLMIESISARDYPVIQVIVPMAAVMFVATNFLVDLTYGWIDPRVKLRST